MSVKLLTAHHWEFISLKGGCTGLSKSTLVKMPHCWKSHVAAQLFHYLMDSLRPIMLLLHSIGTLQGPEYFGTVACGSFILSDMIRISLSYG